MTKIIAVANQKGGVGKTTTCVNLTCAMTKRGKRVLLVDCDPQGNSTSGMGVDKQSTPNCYDMMINGAAAADRPVLGICRGIQLFNVLYGGNLYQDLPTAHPTDTEHHQHPPYDVPIHTVEVLPDTFLSGILTCLKVNYRV